MAVANQLGESLHLGLLGDFQRIVDLDDEIPNCVFEFRVPEQQLNSSEISGPPIDHHSFRSRRMRPYAATLTRGSETKIALGLDVRRRSKWIVRHAFVRRPR